jgi:carnitine-CoA ligase
VTAPVQSLPHEIRDLAQERPDFPAVIEVDGVSVTYRGFDEQMRLWAARLQSIGVGAGDPVVTMVENDSEAYAIWLGVGWLTAIEVPINTAYRGGILHYVINNSEARTMVIAAQFVERLTEIAAGLEHLTTVIVLGPIAKNAATTGADRSLRFVEAATLGREPLAPEELPGPRANDIAAIIFTSGTTGPSKGVVVPWAHWRWWGGAYGENDFVADGERCYSCFASFHTSGKGMFNLTALCRGTLVLRERFSVSHFWDDVRTHDVRTTAMVGPMLSMLLAAEPRPDDRENPLDRFNVAPVGSAVTTFMERFDIRRFTTTYGMTEIALPMSGGWNPPTNGTCGRLRNGRPGFEARVVDEHDQPVGANVVGELIVRSSEPWVMNAGYWRMPEATAHSWRNGWFHTGDAFKVDEDGYFYFVDRLKDALRRRGENISSFEVEMSVAQHPEVLEVAVIGVPSDLGEDEVKAVIVRTPGGTVTAEQLIEYLIPRMADFMVPRYVEFVESLPQTPATLRTRKAELRDAPINEATWDREQTPLRRRR